VAARKGHESRKSTIEKSIVTGRKEKQHFDEQEEYNT
jgi:hypothetical protein